MIKFTPIASGSSGNCYHLTDGHTQILLECGLPFKKIRRALNFNTSSLSAILVSHSHLDHSRAAKEAARAGINVMSSQATLDALGLSGHRFHTITAREQFQLGTWTVLPFETVHEGEKGDTLGFLLASGDERLLFLTDSCYCPVRFSGLNVIAVECNYVDDLLDDNVRAGGVDRSLRKRIKASHMSLSTLKDFLEVNDLSRVRAIYLLHLSDGNSDAERFKKEVEETTGKPVYVA